MKNLIHRRTLLGMLVSGLLAACGQKQADNQSADEQQKADTEPRQPRLKPDDVYQHGVASGDPDQTSVVIWTRVSVMQPAEVTWEVSMQRDFSTLVDSGSAVAGPDQDYTVKAIPTGLDPDETYFYRFKLDGAESPIGRTQTLPVGDVSHFGIALVSCSNFAFGYFNAYDAIAKDEDVDLVLHTGDYIYEYEANGWGSDTAEKLDRVHQPSHEIVSLGDYRTRHAQYKTDPGSQAMHAAHPMICCWDDHESTNNPWLNGAQNHQPEREGSWPARRAASVQAYYEWMPIRDPQDASARLAFSRAYRIGNLASLVTMESRHTARAEQINYLDYVDTIQSADDAMRFKEEVVNEPGRAMISIKTEDLVRETFGKSVSDGQPWRLIGNASPIARMLVPDVGAGGIIDQEPQEQLQSDAAKALLWKGKYNLPFYTDTWDGYPWARERLYASCRSVGAQDLIFLTGDSHSFWMNQLADASGDTMGLEIGTAGVTSPGDFVESGWSPSVAEKLDRFFESELDEVVWTDNLHQGYVRVELTQKLAKASFVAVSSVLSRDYTAQTIKQTFIKRDDQKLDYQT